MVRINFPCARIVLATFTGLLLVTTPAIADQQATSDSLLLRKGISKLYEELEELAQAGHPDLTCTTRNLKWLSRNSLLELTYGDLLSNADRKLISISLPQTGSQPPQLGRDELRAEVHLAPGPDLSEFQHLPAETVMSVVESFHTPGAKVVQAVTYDVTCYDRDWYTEHHATAFLIETDGYSSSLAVDIQDPAIDVASVLHQAARLGADLEPVLAALPEEKRVGGGCLFDVRTTVGFDSRRILPARHNSGYHFLDAEISATTSCTSRCVAECLPKVSGYCGDTGDPTGVGVTGHNHARATSIRGATTEGGGTARCQAAFGCTFGECKFYICPGLSIGLYWTGSGFTFSNTSGAFDQDKVEWGFSKTCTELPDYPPCRLESSRMVAISLAESNVRLLPHTASFAADYPLRELIDNSRGDDSEVQSWLVGDATVVRRAGTSVEGTGVSARRPLSQFAEKPGSGVRQNLPAQSALIPQADYLLIAYPEHPENSRHTKPPILKLDRKLDLSIEETGRVILSVFFDDKGKALEMKLIQLLSGFESLQSEDGSFSEKSHIAFMKDHGSRFTEVFSLQFAGEARHAAVATAVISILPSGTPRLDDSFVYIPRCCCGDWFCN